MFRWQFPHGKKRELQNSQDQNKTNSSKLLYGSPESKETSGPGPSEQGVWCTLQRCHPRGPGRLQSRISSLKRASHLSRSYKNVCWLERSPLCFTLKQLRLGGFVNKTNLLQLLWVFSYWKNFKADDTVCRIMIPKAFYVRNDRKSSHYSFVQAFIFLLQNDFFYLIKENLTKVSLPEPCR